MAIETNFPATYKGIVKKQICFTYGTFELSDDNVYKLKVLKQ
jgi:hypothetical protein